MDAYVESFDRETQMVTLRTTVGTFSAPWMNPYEPETGREIYCELATEPTCVWGIDVTDASPDEPDAIAQDEDGWTFVGTVLGMSDDGSTYVKGGRGISADDLESGIFYLDVGGIISPILAADALPDDATGRRVRVRQTAVRVY